MGENHEVYEDNGQIVTGDSFSEKMVKFSYLAKPVWPYDRKWDMGSERGYEVHHSMLIRNILRAYPTSPELHLAFFNEAKNLSEKSKDKKVLRTNPINVTIAELFAGIAR